MTDQARRARYEELAIYFDRLAEHRDTDFSIVPSQQADIVADAERLRFVAATFRELAVSGCLVVKVRNDCGDSTMIFNHVEGLRAEADGLRFRNRGYPQVLYWNEVRSWEAMAHDEDPSVTV